MDLTGNTAGVGHNNPPSAIDIVGDQAKEKNPELFAHVDALINASENLPEVIANDSDAGKVGDYIKQLTAHKKSINAMRVEEKEPYLAKGRAVDGFFNGLKEDIEKVIAIASPIQAVWITKKKEEERIRKEEAQAKKEEEAAEKLRIAEEKAQAAEDLRIAAEKKQRDAEAKAAAERKAAQDKIDEANRKAEAERKEAERAAAAKQKEIDDLKTKAAEDAQALKDAEEAQKKHAAAEKERIRKEKADKLQREKDAREEERRIKREEKAASEAQIKLERAAKKSDRESNNSLNESMKLDNQAGKLEKSLQDPNHKASRVRGVQGSLSTVRREWVGDFISRDEIDLETLRHHIPEDALQKAVSSYVRAGGRDLKGANIYEQDKVTVR